MGLQILIRFILLFFCLSMMIASAKADINESIRYYQNLQEYSKSSLASIDHLNKTINLFPQLLEDY